MTADEAVGEPRCVSDLLFTEGLPQMYDEVGYRGAVAARAAGITYRQLDYWARTELVEPTVRGATGSGPQRLSGLRDILVLKLVTRMHDTGISLEQNPTHDQPPRPAGLRHLHATPATRAGRPARTH